MHIQRMTHDWTFLYGMEWLSTKFVQILCTDPLLKFVYIVSQTVFERYDSFPRRVTHKYGHGGNRQKEGFRRGQFLISFFSCIFAFTRNETDRLLIAPSVEQITKRQCLTLICQLYMTYSFISYASEPLNSFLASQFLIVLHCPVLLGLDWIFSI